MLLVMHLDTDTSPKKLFIAYSQKYVHPHELMHFWPLEARIKKEEGPKAALTYCFSSSSISLIQLNNKSSTMPKTQRKKISNNR
jgi:hypothetical protein